MPSKDDFSLPAPAVSTPSSKSTFYAAAAAAASSKKPSKLNTATLAKPPLAKFYIISPTETPATSTPPALALTGADASSSSSSEASSSVESSPAAQRKKAKHEFIFVVGVINSETDRDQITRIGAHSTTTVDGMILIFIVLPFL